MSNGDDFEKEIETGGSKFWAFIQAHAALAIVFVLGVIVGAILF